MTTLVPTILVFIVDTASQNDDVSLWGVIQEMLFISFLFESELNLGMIKEYIPPPPLFYISIFGPRFAESIPNTVSWMKIFGFRIKFNDRYIFVDLIDDASASDVVVAWCQQAIIWTDNEKDPGHHDHGATRE